MSTRFDDREQLSNVSQTFSERHWNSFENPFETLQKHLKLIESFIKNDVETIFGTPCKLPENPFETHFLVILTQWKPFCNPVSLQLLVEQEIPSMWAHV